MPQIVEYSQILKNVADECGVGYTSNIVTNGLSLSDITLAKLVELCGVTSFEITIDGDEEEHNVTRSTKTKAPTFKKVLANVVGLANFSREHERDITIKVRCNVSKENYSSVFRLIDKLSDLGLSDAIIFYVAPLHSWGNDADQAALDARQFAEFELAVFLHLFDKNFVTVVLPTRKKITCLAVHKDGVIVSPDGRLFNCTEVPLVPLYDDRVDYEVSGNGDAKEKPFSEFMDGVAAGEWPCANCEFLPVCGGSCPKQWLEGYTPCPPFKRNMGERLVFQYLKSVSGVR